MSVEITSFKNKAGKEIKVLGIEQIKANGNKYTMKIGCKKAKAVLDNKDDIEFVMKQNGN